MKKSKSFRTKNWWINQNAFDNNLETNIHQAGVENVIIFCLTFNRILRSPSRNGRSSAVCMSRDISFFVRIFDSWATGLFGVGKVIEFSLSCSGCFPWLFSIVFMFLIELFEDTEEALLLLIKSFPSLRDSKGSSVGRIPSHWMRETHNWFLSVRA